MPASAIAATMRAPKPGASSPSTLSVARFFAGATPSACAALRAAEPLSGVRKTTPVPDFAASRRAMTHSRLAPVFPSAPRTFARPPGLSSILALQMSTFVTVKLIRIALLCEAILEERCGRASQFGLAGAQTHHWWKLSPTAQLVGLAHSQKRGDIQVFAFDDGRLALVEASTSSGFKLQSLLFGRLRFRSWLGFGGVVRAVRLFFGGLGVGGLGVGGGRGC